MSKLGQLRDVPPKKVRKGDCQDVVVKGDEVDLMTLPALHTWPDDGGAYFNLGLDAHQASRDGPAQPGPLPVATPRQEHHRDALADPQGFERPSRGGRTTWRAVAGCDRVRRATRSLTYAASAPLPSESTNICSPGSAPGTCRDGRPPQRAARRFWPMRRFALEGWLEPGERMPEGPFGDHSGFDTGVGAVPGAARSK